MSPLRRRALRRGIAIAIAVVAVIVVVLLGLIAGGILVLPAPPSPTPVTVSYVVLQIQQGNTSDGVPWFGPSPINITTGFPLSVTPGGTFSVVWLNFFNFDSVNHTINRVTPSAPFRPVSTIPTLPFLVAYDSGDHNLQINIQAPSPGGGTYVVTVIVTALTEG